MELKINEQLRIARQRLGLTQVQLAEEAGVSVMTVSKLESDQWGSCRVATLDAIVWALDLELHIIIREPNYD